MKAILEFNLPEDSEAFEMHQKVGMMNSAIYDALQYIRNQLKYADPSEETEKHLEALREILTAVDIY